MDAIGEQGINQTLILGDFGNLFDYLAAQQGAADMMNALVSSIPNFTVAEYLAWVRSALGESTYQNLLQSSPQALNFDRVITLEEQYLYGSKRLGVRRPGLEMARAAHNPSGYELPVEPPSPTERFGNDCLCNERLPDDEEPYYPGAPFTARFYTHTLGMKEYEITNHLGNVLATVLDRKTGVKASPTATTYAWFKADVSTAQDYYPFGSLMPGRTYVAPMGTGYRFGFNGQQRDDEIAGPGNSMSALFWQYDSRLGRRWNVDPKPNATTSIYATFANNPIMLGDPLGDTVTYEGLRERMDVTWGRIKSKEFRAKFRQLKNDTRTWNFNSNVPQNRGLSGGGIYLSKDLRNSEKIPESQYTFDIYYNRDANANAPEYGLSRLHYMFEETYHATEYLNGVYGAGINEQGFIGTRDKVNSEIDANVWAALNAPGGSMQGTNSGNIPNARGAIAPPGSLRTPSYKAIILQNQNNREAMKVIIFGSWTAHYRGKISVKTGEIDPNGLERSMIENFDYKQELPGVQR